MMPWTHTRHAAYSLALALPSALAPASAQDCPDEGRTHVAGPSDDITTVDCAQVSGSFHVKIEAGGTISVVSAGVAGAVEVTYQSPATCRTSQVTYDGDIHQCGVFNEGEKCKTKGYKVTQKKFANLDPCPSTSIFAIIRQFVTNGGELPDCGELVEVDLGTNSVRWSATTEKCADGSHVPTSTILPEGALVDGPSSTYLSTYGDPRAVAVAAGQSPYTAQFVGFDVLLDYLEGPEGGSIQHPIGALLEASRPVADFESLAVTATIVHHDVPGYGAVENVYSASGRFRSDGTYHLQLADSGTDAEGASVAFVEEWTRDHGGLAFGIVGNPQALYFPSENGADQAKEVHRLPFVNRVTRWLQNPFRLSTSPAARYETIQHSGYREVRMSFDADPAIADATRSLFFRDGAPWTRPLRSEVRTLAGDLIEATEYGDYQFVAPNVARPMAIKESVYRGGDLFKTVELSFLGEEANLAGDTSPLPMPRPLEGRWFVQID